MLQKHKEENPEGGQDMSAEQYEMVKGILGLSDKEMKQIVEALEEEEGR